MFVRQTILIVCMTSMLAAVSLPVAAGDRFTSQPGAGHDTPQFLMSVSGPTFIPDISLRNPQQDLREPRLASVLPGILGLQGNSSLGLGRQVAADKESANLSTASASLLSLHCLLVV